MKLKRYALWALLAGFVIALAGVAMPLAVLYLTPQDPRISIIGAADAPTYYLIISTLLDNMPWVLVLLGLTLMISAVFCLLFSKTVRGHCTVKTSLISLGLSATGALGLICVLVWFSIVAFDEVSKHPIEYPLSIAAGLLCLCAFITLILQYFNMRKEKWSGKGLLIDVLTSIIYLPVFFYIFSYLCEIVG